MNSPLFGTYFHAFESDISTFSLPKTFDYPHQFTPHPLAVIAAKQFQEQFLEKNTFKYNFGLDSHDQKTKGKMFGVLVIKDQKGKIGFFAGFSGKIGDSNHYQGMVPPILDTLLPHGILKQGELKLQELHDEITCLESAPKKNELEQKMEALQQDFDNQIQETVEHLKLQKEKRRIIRLTLDPINDLPLIEKLAEESKLEQILLKKKKKENKVAFDKLRQEWQNYQNSIELIKTKRAEKSMQIQTQLFDSYKVTNVLNEIKTIKDIFLETNGELPPSGTGECVAPKLLQFAFDQNFIPICFAEFWWGKSPIGILREHKHFYPACRRKCEPLLQFMLKGIDVNPHPLSISVNELEKLEILYEDEYLLAINKPASVLSVPGKSSLKSIQDRLRELYPEFPELHLVHRLDMGTSGILLAGKTLEIYKSLQKQFAKREVHKTYTALLVGTPKNQNGHINLPLRVDLEHRPHQMVCFEHGKTAVSRYQVLETKNDITRVEMYPETGRTHQLRVHAAHHLGLHCPILGDELYGTPKDRLYLHASGIKFTHPIYQKTIEINCAAPF